MRWRFFSFSHERSLCFHLPVFKGKKKAESVLGWQKIYTDPEWGGRAVTGSSQSCDVCGREMKPWNRITVVFLFCCYNISAHVRKAARAWRALEHVGTRARCCVSVRFSIFLYHSSMVSLLSLINILTAFCDFSETNTNQYFPHWICILYTVYVKKIPLKFTYLHNMTQPCVITLMYALF